MRAIPHRAFTILELLLALLLTSMLTAAISVMIGQAARDRHEMDDQSSEPPWTHAVIGSIERDLQHAQWWAATEQRLVLIGTGAEGMPAHIEYHWLETDGGGSWVRHETLLMETTGEGREAAQQVMALGLSSVSIGAYHFGEPPLETGIGARSIDTDHTEGIDLAGITVTVEGQRLPLSFLPDQIEVGLVIPGSPPQVIRRRVVLR